LGKTRLSSELHPIHRQGVPHLAWIVAAERDRPYAAARCVNESGTSGPFAQMKRDPSAIFSISRQISYRA
jgi:hypothetical protein